MLSEEEILARVASSYEVPNDVLQEVPLPLVTVRTSTYQHGPYIRECIEGIIRQKTSFPFEYIIGEDFSTDGTREIVLEYAAKYPNLIRVFTADCNVGAKANGRRCLNASRGKYMAICEGDDYWHDPTKLQKQVEIMEANPEVSMVCSDVDVYSQATGRKIPSVDRRLGTWENLTEDITTSIILRKLTPYTCSVMMRTSDLSRIREEHPYEFSSKWPMGDVQTFVELSLLGRIHHINESLATYRALPESASRTKDENKVVQFNMSVHELSSHYIRRLGLPQHIQQKLDSRMFHLFAGEARFRNSEILRLHALHFLHAHAVQPSNLWDRWAVWGVSSARRQSVMRRIYPVAAKVLKSKQRGFRLLARAANSILPKTSKLRNANPASVASSQ